MTLAAYSLGDALLTMLVFFLWIIWIYLLIIVFMDIFRSKDLSGIAKALWVLFVIILPFLGVLVYLIARGDKMQEHAIGRAQAQQEQFDSAVRDAAGSGGGSAAEVEKLAELRDKGVLSEEEFQAAKAKALG